MGTKNTRKEQKERLALFGELVAPYVRPGAEENLRAQLTHQSGRKFAAFISHGELNKLFVLHEVTQGIAEATPCLYGINQREITTWDEAEKGMLWGDSGLAIALDGSWMAIKQEMKELRIYVPAAKPRR